MIKIDLDTGRNNARIIEGDFSRIREFFSVKNQAAVFARKRGFFAPERTYVITPTGKFEPHFYNEIIKQVSNSGENTNIALTENFKNFFNSDLKFEYSDKKLNLDLRDYQEEVVRTCIKQKCGVIELATAGGKTLIISSLLENIFHLNPNFKCLLIVPDLGLVKQTKGDFAEYKVNFTYSIWTGNDELNLNVNVIIANTGILLSENSPVDWTENVDLLIVDEVHKVRRGNKINKLIKKIYTPHKFGFTGTLPEDPLDQWNIFSKFGSVIYSKKSFELKVESYVTPAKITGLILNYEDPPVFEKTAYDTPAEHYLNELRYIIGNNYRNRIIAQLCSKFDNNSLILVDLIDHGLELHRVLSECNIGKEIYFIRGEVEVEERKRVQTLMENQSNICVIAISKIFSTGINIKNLHYLIFAAGGKAKVKIIQSIGRGLRLHADKKELLIFDIIDNLKYGMQHAAKRKSLYLQEKIPFTAVNCYEKQSSKN